MILLAHCFVFLEETASYQNISYARQESNGRRSKSVAVCNSLGIPVEIREVSLASGNDCQIFILAV